MDILNGHQLILGSQSPRRKKLLGMLHIPFIQEVKEVEEIYAETLQKEEISNYLAELKANAFELKENQVILTSDTIVWVNDLCLGKPKNKKEAFEMLWSMRGNTHSVFTSVCLKSKARTHVFYAETKVAFLNFTQNELDFYIDKFKPYDKAGAYGIQEWIGAAFVSEIRGSHFNVMGLPVHLVYQELKEFCK